MEKANRSEEEAELARVTKEWRKTQKLPSGYTAVPPDGGYGWVVIFGSFLVTTMISIPTLVFGIILKDMIRFTGSTTAQASWTVSISLAVSQFVGPVTTVLIHRFGCRTTVIVGGIITSLGLFLSTFAASIQMLYFTFGILTGVGIGFSRAPSIVVGSLYFRVRFGVAAGIIFAGFGCGRLIFSPICQKTLDYYGFQGTFIIISGICLNICVGATLFQPVARHLVLKKTEKPFVSIKEAEEKKKEAIAQEKQNTVAKTQNDDQKDEIWVPMKVLNQKELEEQREFLDPARKDKLNGEKMANYLTGSVESGLHIPIQQDKKAANPPAGCMDQIKKELLSSLDFTLMKTPVFYLICFGGIITYLSILYSNVFLFPLAVDRGLEPIKASMVVTAKAAAEIVGRVGFPWIQQLVHIDPILFYVFICAFVAFLLLAQALVVSYPAFITMAVLTGLFSGGMVVQNTSVTLTIMGAPRYPSVIGLCSFVQSFFALFAGPFIGLVRDLTGSFVQCFLLIMGVQFLACSMWLSRYIYVLCFDKPITNK